MMTGTITVATRTNHDYQHLDRIREKFHEVFGRDCPFPDDMILQRYDLTNDGDLVMFLR